MTTERANIKCEAVFSDNSEHRYCLSKIWDKTRPIANIITIAPSEDYNVSSDMTTNIICNNVHLLGMGGFTLTNLISKIGINIKKIKNTSDLWNNDTDKYISDLAEKADKVIIAWGKFAQIKKEFSEREKEVFKLLEVHSPKVFHIVDGSGREFLHPLTPAIRRGWILENANSAEYTNF